MFMMIVADKPSMIPFVFNVGISPDAIKFSICGSPAELSVAAGVVVAGCAGVAVSVFGFDWVLLVPEP
ncbi:hypothetical protein BRE01_49470 [Brevibacillus reuszeri]|uniref:Uncharacterized protein n=1 Tax=Brevibacillus reuszeri TaxID=54915 RepID=A0ABQ0TTV0_9BACL|nr:hypothetical protein BRE01_49470 [Brevibacillus reuszeri]